MDSFVARVSCAEPPLDQWLATLGNNDYEPEVSETERWFIGHDYGSSCCDEQQLLSAEQYHDVSTAPEVAHYQQFDSHRHYRLETIPEESSDAADSECSSSCTWSHSSLYSEDNERSADDTAAAGTLAFDRCNSDHSCACTLSLASHNDRTTSSARAINTAIGQKWLSDTFVAEYSDIGRDRSLYRCSTQPSVDICGAALGTRDLAREKVDDIWRSSVSTAARRLRSADADKKCAICACTDDYCASVPADSDRPTEDTHTVDYTLAAVTDQWQRQQQPHADEQLSDRQHRLQKQFEVQSQQQHLYGQLEQCQLHSDDEQKPKQLCSTVYASCESLDRRIELLTFDFEEEEERSQQQVPLTKLEEHHRLFAQLLHQLADQYRPVSCQHSAVAISRCCSHSGHYKQLDIGNSDSFGVSGGSQRCDGIEDCVVCVGNCAVVWQRRWESDSALDCCDLMTMKSAVGVFNSAVHQPLAMSQSAENLSEDSGYGDRTSPPRSGGSRCANRSALELSPSSRRRQRLWALICRNEQRSARIYADAPISCALESFNTAAEKRPTLFRSESQRQCCPDDVICHMENHNSGDSRADNGHPVPAPRSTLRPAIYQNLPSNSKILQSSGQNSSPVAYVDTPRYCTLTRSVSSPTKVERRPEHVPDSGSTQHTPNNNDPRDIYLSDEETNVFYLRRSAAGRPKPLNLEMAEEFILLESNTIGSATNSFEKFSKLPSRSHTAETNVFMNTSDRYLLESNSNLISLEDLRSRSAPITRTLSLDTLLPSLRPSATANAGQRLGSEEKQCSPVVSHSARHNHIVTSSTPNLPSEVASEAAWMRALSTAGGVPSTVGDERAARLSSSYGALSRRIISMSVLAEREWLEASMEPESVEPRVVVSSTVDATAYRRQRFPTVATHGSSGNQVQVFITRHSESSRPTSLSTKNRRSPSLSAQPSPAVSHVQWSDSCDKRPVMTPGAANDCGAVAANKSAPIIRSKSPHSASHRSPATPRSGHIYASTSGLSSSVRLSPTSPTPPARRVAPDSTPHHLPQQRGPTSGQRVQFSSATIASGDGRHVITADRRLLGPAKQDRRDGTTAGGASAAREYHREVGAVSNNNNNYQQVLSADAKPTMGKVKQKSFLQKLGFGKGVNKQKSPATSPVAPVSPSSPDSVRFQSEAVTSTPLTSQPAKVSHNSASNGVKESSTGNGVDMTIAREKPNCHNSTVSSNGSAHDASFSSAERTPKSDAKFQKPPLPPQAIQKAQPPSNRMRLHSARRSFLGANALLESAGDSGQPVLYQVKSTAAPVSSDAEVKLAFQKFSDGARRDRERLAKSTPDVSAIESVTRSSVRLSAAPAAAAAPAGPAAVVFGHSRSQRCQEAERAFSAARSRLRYVSSAPSNGVGDDTGGTPHLQYRETELGSTEPAAGLQRSSRAATSAERAKSMVHLPRGEESDSSRAKSMEFLLDDSNKAATLPPENQLCSAEAGGRPPSEAQLRFQRSLRNLNVPDWYRRSYRGEAALRRHRSLGASHAGGWAVLQSKSNSRESLGSNWSGHPAVAGAGAVPHKLVVPSRVRPPASRQRTISATSTTSSCYGASSCAGSSCGDGQYQLLRRWNSGSLRQPYYTGWRSQERLAAAAAAAGTGGAQSGYRTPTERLADSVTALTVARQPPAQPDISESIRQVSSAIVDYFDGEPRATATPANLATGKTQTPAAWHETSFVGRSPPMPTARRSMSAVPARLHDNAVLV